MRYLAALLLFVAGPVAFAQDVNEKNEQAMKDASAKVAASTVKIETLGGQDVVPSGPAGPGPRGPGVRKGLGPTTGVVVGADGYIITSSFNFANKPTTIFVTVPGHPERLVAEEVSSDTTRMLTLIKLKGKDFPKLTVPAAVPKGELAIGQWSLALGRSLMPDVGAMPPSISAGIISALGRINGKCLQTDAKVSPANYGGPLVAIDGRVQGILVPASQNGEGDVSGVEWYDSGIGFAIPFEDVLAVVPKMKTTKILRRGLLGITPQNQEPHMQYTPVFIGTISPGSAAAKAGLKVGDKIVSIDKKPVPHFVAMQHVLGPKYEGDVVDIKIYRDANEMDFPGVQLTGIVTAVASGFLGILPLRDDPDPGVPVRFVYPKSPAEVAGLKVGDRIMKVAPVLPGAKTPPPALEITQGRPQLNAIVARTAPGQELELEVKRAEGGKTDKLKVKLAAVPDEELPAALPLPSSAERALDKPKGAKEEPKPKEEPKKDDDKKEDEKKEPEVGLKKKKNAVLGREYWVYVPLNYKPSVSHGLIVWLHPAGKGGKDADEMAKIWRPFLEDYHYILVGPKSQSNDGWVASETEGIISDVKEVTAQHTVDRSRVIAHGMGVGGQMAFYLGFSARDTIRGVATTGASLGTQPKDIVPGQPLAFFIVGGEKDPAVKSIADSIPPLKDKKFPVIYRQLKDFGKEYMLQPTLIELCVWIDSIDKI